jgi:hypothetical protein
LPVTPSISAESRALDARMDERNPKVLLVVVLALVVAMMLPVAIAVGLIVVCYAAA